mgnify:CR=1 FL=1
MGMSGKGNRATKEELNGQLYQVLGELNELGMPIDLSIESNSYGTQLYANNGSQRMSYVATKTEILIALNAMKNLLQEINDQNRKAERN